MKTKEERDAERERRYPPIEFPIEFTYDAVVHGREVTITRYRAPQARGQSTVISTRGARHMDTLATSGLGDCIKEVNSSEILTTTDVRNAIAPPCDFSHWRRRSK